VANQGWICPDAPLRLTNATLLTSNGMSFAGTVNSAWLANGVDSPEQAYYQTNRAGSYAANGWLVQWAGGTGYHPQWYWTQESQIQHTAKTPVFADGVAFWQSWPIENDLPAINLQTGDAPTQTDMNSLTIPRHGSHPSQVATDQPANARLPGSINVSFYDGHVAAVPLEGLWQLEWHQGWQTPAVRPGL